MPQIPSYLTKADLPSSDGIQGGTVQVPVINQPGADTAGGAMLGKALGALPEALQQAGGLIARTEELATHRQKAFDTQNAANGFQDWRHAAQAMHAEARQGDYQSLQERVYDTGMRLIEDYGKGLSAGARALYVPQAKEFLNVLHQRAIDERTKRTGEATQYLMSRAVQQAQEDYAGATTDYERIVARGHLEETLQGFVETGLVDGGTAATLLKKTMDAVADQRVQTAIQADPDAMKGQLQAQTQGLPTRDDLPVARPETLATLTQQATEVSRARFAEREHAERYEDYQRQKRQTQASVDVRAQIYTTLPTPENVPTFQRLIQQTTEAMRKGEIDPATGEHLLQTAQAHATAAAKPPPQVDDPAVERTISLAVMMAESPQQFAQARETLTQAGLTRLRPETFRTLSDKLEQREKASYWRDRPAVKAAQDVLVRGVLLSYGGSLAGLMKPQQQQKLLWAMDSLEQQLQGLAGQDVREVGKQAMDLAWQVRIQFLKPDKDDLAAEYLPPRRRRPRHRMS